MRKKTRSNKFFDLIRSDISEVMPKTYFNDKVTWIMEAGF